MRSTFVPALLAAVASVWTSDLAAQTSIIAVRTPDSIMIGADSRATSLDGKEAALQCKVGRTKEVTWARARYASDPENKFNFETIADNALSAQGALEDRVAGFEQIVVPQLTQVMSARKKATPEWFESQAEGKSVLDVVFAAFERGSPHLLLRYFKVYTVEGAVTIQVLRKDCPGDCPSGNAIVGLGHHETADAELAKNPQIWRRGIDGVRYLVQREIDACPKFVGPPIALIKLEANKTTWVCDGVCNSSAALPSKIEPNTSTRCDEAP